METIAKGGVRIDYTDQGQGEPALLYMPPWCSGRAVFGQAPVRSATKRRVLALDWRGHGQSEVPADDFGASDLVEDALAVIAASGVEQVIPVSSSHAGWVAIELRQRLGARIPKLVLTDWLVVEPPPEYVEVVKGLAFPETWEQTREILFNIWLEGVDNPAAIRFVREEMASYGAEMWMRSGREIGGCYARGGSPLKALAQLDPPVPTLHLYAQPADPGYLAVQQAFASEHPWFKVQTLAAASHFPAIEVPDEVAAAIEAFVA